jgi:ABC-2 type transport system ATP-binding protein
LDTRQSAERHTVLVCRSVVKTYGSGPPVVDRVDLQVRAGEVVGLLGHNGAGKTTLMRLITGLVRPDSGELNVLGDTPPLPAATARGLGAALDTPAFYRWMSGQQMLVTLLNSSGLPDRGEAAAALERVGLDGRKKIRAYSQGMRQRLALAAALMLGPDLLVLDEPTNGLDPAAVRGVRDLLAAERDRGAAILVSSHQLDEMQRLCDRLVVMRQGRVVAEGGREQLGLGMPGGPATLEDWFFRTAGDDGRGVW